MATLLKVDPQRGHTGNVEVGKSITGGEVRKYQVFFTGTDATGSDAMNAAGVPAYGATMGVFVLTSKSAEALDDCSVWMVTCTYTFPQPGEEAKPDDPAIERWAIDVTMNSAPYEVEAQYDADGNPIANSAGDPITGVTVPRYDEELTIVFTTDEVDWPGILGCIGKANSVEFMFNINGQTRTFEANTAVFTDYSLAYTADVSGATYPKCTYRLRVRSQTWTRKVANKGLNKSEGGVKSPITVEDEDGNLLPITEPVYLATDYGDTPPTVEAAALGATVEQLSFEIYEKIDLSTLLLWGLDT